MNQSDTVISIDSNQAPLITLKYMGYYKKFIYIFIALVVIIPVVLYLASPTTPITGKIVTNKTVLERFVRDENFVPRSAIDKSATLDVTYKNNTSSPLTDVQVWMTIEGAYPILGVYFGSLPESTTRYNKDESNKVKRKYIVFNAPDVPPHSTGKARIYFYGSTPGFYAIQSKIKTKQTPEITLNKINISIN